MKLAYPTPEALRITGLTHRQIGYILEHVILTPSVSYLSRNSHHIRWSEEDVLLLGIVKAMRTADLPTAVIGKAMRVLRRRVQTTQLNILDRLFISDGDIAITSETQAYPTALGQITVVINIKRIVARTSKAIEAFAAQGV